MRIVVHSILYFFGLGENPLPNPQHKLTGRSDIEAMRSDWCNVGLDIYNAMNQYGAATKN